MPPFMICDFQCDHGCEYASAYHPRLRTAAVWIVLLAVFGMTCAATAAQVSKEYQIKAVCVWRLAQFVTWPDQAFESDQSPIVIGVLGENPFGDALEIAVDDETAHGRKLLVRSYGNLSEIGPCHILFVSRSKMGQIKEILGRLAGHSILTVADFPDFAASHGGMVCLLTHQNKVKLQINVRAVNSAGLRLDSRLLRSADIIKDN